MAGFRSESIRRNPFLFFGLPFLSFMVLGSHGLAMVIRGRHELQDERKKRDVILSREVDLSRKKIVDKRYDIEKDAEITEQSAEQDYAIKRIPRVD